MSFGFARMNGRCRPAEWGASQDATLSRSVHAEDCWGPFQLRALSRQLEFNNFICNSPLFRESRYRKKRVHCKKLLKIFVGTKICAHFATRNSTWFDAPRERLAAHPA